MNSTTTRPRVLIIGAGYAGAMAANKLAASGRVAVTVINPRPDFVERIRLHEFVAGTGVAVHPLTEVLDPQVELVVDSATRINETSVALAGGEAREFDYLIYAVGSFAQQIPGSDDAFSVADFPAATKLRDRISTLPDGARVTIIGGGLTAIETATEIAEAQPQLRVSLFSDRPVAHTYPEKSRRYVERTLTRLGVATHVGPMVEKILPDSIVLNDGTQHASDCTVLVAGMKAPDLALNSGLAVDELGRVRTDESLRSVDNPRVFAVGDAAALPPELGTHIRMACATAIPTGAHAANTILAHLDGTTEKVFSLGYLGQCVSLGRHAGILQFSHRDDTAVGFALKRRTAATIKEGICSGVLVALGKPGWARWVPGPKAKTPKAKIRAEKAMISV